MKALKITLLTIVSLIVLYFVISLFLPSTVHVKRSTLIDAPVEVIFFEINDLRNWDEWSPWHQIDPNWEVSFFGEPMGVGSGYEWRSDNQRVGNGKITILYSEPYDSIVTEMDFLEHGTATGYYTFDETENGVKVTWGMITEMGNRPFQKYTGLMMDKWVGSDFETGLENLSEASKKLSPWIPDYSNVPDRDYIGIESTATQENISQIMADNYGKLHKFIAMQDEINISGAPFAMYRDFKENGDVHFVTGILIDGVTNGFGEIEYNIIPSGNYVSINYFGPYEKLEAPHTFIQNWIRDHDFIMADYPLEFYITDPQKVEDPNKWLTIISYRVSEK